MIWWIGSFPKRIESVKKCIFERKSCTLTAHFIDSYYYTMQSMMIEWTKPVHSPQSMLETEKSTEKGYWGEIKQNPMYEMPELFKVIHLLC